MISTKLLPASSFEPHLNGAHAQTGYINGELRNKECPTVCKQTDGDALIQIEGLDLMFDIYSTLYDTG